MSVHSRIELEFGNVGFWGEGKTGEPQEKPLGAEQRTNKINLHVTQVQESNPRHIGGRHMLSPRHCIIPTT